MSSAMPIAQAGVCDVDHLNELKDEKVGEIADAVGRWVGGWHGKRLGSSLTKYRNAGARLRESHALQGTSHTT